MKGYLRSTVFAMGKFALRGLAQSMARELAPKGIHVARFVIYGAVRQKLAPRASWIRLPKGQGRLLRYSTARDKR